MILLVYLSIKFYKYGKFFIWILLVSFFLMFLVFGGCMKMGVWEGVMNW